MSIAGRTVEIRWRNGRTRALVWYAGAFVVVLLYIAFGQGQFGSVHRALMASAALGLCYFVAVQLANVTRLCVENDELVVEHGPLPWRGRTVLPIDRVRRLHVDRHAARLELKTVEGEELTLLDDLAVEKLPELDAQLASMLETKEPQA